MRTSTRRAAALAGLGLTVALLTPSVAASAAPVPQAVPGVSGSPSALAWGGCPTTSGPPDPRQQCATVPVPLNYTDPAGPTIPLTISRIRTAQPGRRRGDLFLIPGGPGGSGLNGPSTDAARLPAAVLDEYDLIGFDPRGVGASSPVTCDLPAAEQDILEWPGPGGDISANIAKSQATVTACAANGGPVLRTISTPTEARDIDRIRIALGERTISYWAVSYGTYVGAVYANLFGQHTDRVLLDSSDDPNPALVERGWLANYAVGVEDRFPDFAAWAAQPGNPQRIAATPADVRTDFLALAARLDVTPIPWPGANPPELTGNVLRENLLEALYSDSGFPGLATLILAAQHGTPLPSPRNPPQSILQNTDAAGIATVCQDIRFPTSIADYARNVVANQLEYPLTGGMPATIGPCAFWPYPPTQQPVAVTSAGPSNVLMVQNLRDPATPYSAARNMLADFGDRARMITVDSGGHGAYLDNGNACGDELVTRFLVTGQRPAHGAFCPAEQS
jgi:pimeloyl-ACP methyl ester carboxylesterase